MLETGSEVRRCPRHGDVETPYIVIGGERTFAMCPKCEEEAKRKEEADMASVLKAKTEDRWRASRVREKFFGKGFGDFVAGNRSQEEARDAAKSIAEGGSRSLILCGGNGVGKTMLANIAVMVRGGVIYKMYDIAVRIKSSYKAGAREDERDILDELSTVTLLVIDEVGRQFGSESERNWLSYVVDERYERGLPTILISNLRPKRLCPADTDESGCLEYYIGRDAVSRLCETADIVLVEGDDFRRKGVDKKM